MEVTPQPEARAEPAASCGDSGVRCCTFSIRVFDLGWTVVGVALGKNPRSDAGRRQAVWAQLPAHTGVRAGIRPKGRRASTDEGKSFPIKTSNVQSRHSFSQCGENSDRPGLLSGTIMRRHRPGAELERGFDFGRISAGAFLYYEKVRGNSSIMGNGARR